MTSHAQPVSPAIAATPIPHKVRLIAGQKISSVPDELNKEIQSDIRRKRANMMRLRRLCTQAGQADDALRHQAGEASHLLTTMLLAEPRAKLAIISAINRGDAQAFSSYQSLFPGTSKALESWIEQVKGLSRRIVHANDLMQRKLDIPAFSQSNGVLDLSAFLDCDKDKSNPLDCLYDDIAASLKAMKDQATALLKSGTDTSTRLAQIDMDSAIFNCIRLNRLNPFFHDMPYTLSSDLFALHAEQAKAIQGHRSPSSYPATQGWESKALKAIHVMTELVA